MPRKKKTELPALAAYLQAELQARGLTLVEIEAATNIPDSTLSRIFNGTVPDPKLSQLAKIARAMGIPFWKVSARAIGGDDETGPANATEELQRIAVIVGDNAELQSILTKLVGLSPRDIRAVRKYIELLRAGD